MKSTIMSVFLYKHDCKDYSLINLCILNMPNWNLKVMSLLHSYGFENHLVLFK